MVTARNTKPGVDLRTVLGKTIVILRSFTHEDHGLSLAELGRRTGLAKGTLHRLASELVALGLLERTEDTYRLGRHLFELGMRASVERTMIEVATPFMEDLYESSHETVHLGVREGIEVIYVAKIGGHRQAATPSRVGGRLPLYCTAVGKSLLAHAPDQVLAKVVQSGLVRRTPRTLTGAGLLKKELDQVNETGLSYEFEESVIGVVCVASPVFDADGSVTAAISIAGPIHRFRPQHHGPGVRAAAQGITATLGRRDARHGQDDTTRST